MLRLTLVFLLWLASTAHSLEERRDHARAPAERHWDLYTRLTDTNVRTIFAADHGCPGPQPSAEKRTEER